MKSTLRTVVPIYAMAIILIAFKEIGFLHFPEPFNQLTTEIGVALLAVASIHILDHKTLIKEVAEKVSNQTQDAFTSTMFEATTQMTDTVKLTIDQAKTSIVTNVIKQTQEGINDAAQVLQRHVTSINVMEICNMVAIHQSRNSAAPQIRKEMALAQEVRMMGISLNEFYRLDEGEFRAAWADLVDGIKNGKQTARILLVDPYCHGAVLRSYSETHEMAGVQDRLEDDVKAAARMLHQLREDLKDKASKLDVRVYSLTPTTFICQTEAMTFTQPYHFWKRRLPGCPIPVFQYRKRVSGHTGVCIHNELEQHFNFVWEYASIPLDTLQRSKTSDEKAGHFWPQPTRGLEWGAHASGMDSVFIDRDRPAFRMREELTKSKELRIQGITLNAFFDESSLARELKRRLTLDGGDQPNIRILVLDPNCEQAKFRAYREFRLNTSEPIPTIAEFSVMQYYQSRLYIDLQSTIKKLGNLPGVQSRMYDSAPHLFALIGDTAAFIEQYTYGKIIEDNPNEEVILGSDMPLIEYSKAINVVYKNVLKQMKSDENDYMEKLRPQPYPLLIDHFDYAWLQAKPL